MIRARAKPGPRGLAACLLAGLAGAAPLQACPLPKDAVTVQAGRVDLDGRTFTMATQTLADLNDARSRLLVLDAHCRLAWSATVDGILSHFDIRALGGIRLLQFVTMQVAGDGTGYVHRLLSMRGGRVGLLLPPIRHTGKDGFYLGRLGRGREEGIVTWIADPRGESEADAHPFVVRRWFLSGNALAGPAQYETTRKYAAPDDALSRPDFIARALGLPFRDQTGDDRSRFRDYDRVAAHVEDLAARLADGR